MRKGAGFLLAIMCALALAGCGTPDNAEKEENDISQPAVEESTASERTDDVSTSNDAQEPVQDIQSIFDELAWLEYQPYTCDGLPEYSLTADDGTTYYMNFSEKWVWRGKEEQAELPDGIISWLEANKGVAGMESDTSWSAEQIEEAKQTALDYYAGTVFSVNSIEYTEEKIPYGDVADGCNFTVNVSKDGVVQEPDRTIILQLNNGDWEVVNEGY